MSSREVALSVLGFLDVPAPELVDVAADAGFDAVSLRVTGSHEPGRGDLRTPADVTATARRLAARDVAVIDVEVVRLGPDLDLDETRRAVDTAAALGARHLLTVDTGWGRPAPLVEQVQQVDELATAVGVRTCLEFMRFSRCGDLRTAVAAATTAGVAVLVDVLHLFRSGGDASTLAGAVDEHGAGLFPYVQLCDAPLRGPGDAGLRDEAVTARLLPGEGELPLGDVLATLPSTTPVAVEAPTRALRDLPAADRAQETMRATRALLTERRP